MTSGIYQLTFNSGKRYIGKSIDIASRWKQHFDKFSKGTAAKNMQYEFKMYGYPKTEVIYECHEDHIDLMEAFFIARLNPELNTTRPADPFIGYYNEDLDEITKWLKDSTIEHAKRLNNLTAKINLQVDEIDELEEKVAKLSLRRSKEEIEAAGRDLVWELQDKVVDYERMLQQANNRIKYLELPWWKKLF